MVKPQTKFLFGAAAIGLIVWFALKKNGNGATANNGTSKQTNAQNTGINSFDFSALRNRLTRRIDPLSVFPTDAPNLLNPPSYPLQNNTQRRRNLFLNRPPAGSLTPAQRGEHINAVLRQHPSTRVSDSIIAGMQMRRRSTLINTERGGDDPRSMEAGNTPSWEQRLRSSFGRFRGSISGAVGNSFRGLSSRFGV